MSKYAYLILFFERYSFAGSQSGQYLLPNTIIFFIFIAPILNYIYLLLYMKKGHTFYKYNEELVNVVDINWVAELVIFSHPSTSISPLQPLLFHLKKLCHHNILQKQPVFPFYIKQP